MKIGIICGHGAGDSGAVSKRYGTEADLVRKLAPKIKQELLTYEGVSVSLFDTKRNWYDYLQKYRYDFTNHDYIIELHANSGAKDTKGDKRTTGLEIFVTTSEKGTTVEQEILSDLSRKFGLKNRGVKRTNFMVISEIKRQGVSACLIENGFMDDKDDMEIITKNINSYSKVLADAIAKGFGLKKKKASSSSKPKCVVEYMTTYGNKRYLNVYDADTLVDTNFHGKYNQKLTIGTTGARNCFETYKNGVATGESHGKKEKGTTLLVRDVKYLK